MHFLLSLNIVSLYLHFSVVIVIVVVRDWLSLGTERRGATKVGSCEVPKNTKNSQDGGSPCYHRYV